MSDNKGPSFSEVLAQQRPTQSNDARPTGNGAKEPAPGKTGGSPEGHAENAASGAIDEAVEKAAQAEAGAMAVAAAQQPCRKPCCRSRRWKSPPRPRSPPPAAPPPCWSTR